LPQFFGIKTSSSSLIIFQWAELSTRSIINLCWCNRRTFWRKNTAPWEGHYESLVLARQCRNSPSLATQKKLVYLGFQCLDHLPFSPDLALSDYHLFPGLKNNWNVAIFHPTQRPLLPRRSGWTYNILIFFGWLSTVRTTGQELHWASWEVRLINPEFGCCSLFPSWSGTPS
jgi:hypothetical protein